jgi:Cytochrome C oxidase, cbb3-type, subunit III
MLRCNRTAAIVIATASFLFVLQAAAGLLFVYSGVYDVSASSKDNPIVAWTLHKTYEVSLHRHAGGDVPPVDFLSLENIRAGARFYHSACAICHGAPGRPPGAIALGLQPAAPALLAATRRNNPILMFWVIKHGVNMTAMPAFGKSQPDSTLWQTAAFLYHARGIGRDEYEDLTGAGVGHASVPE